METINKIIEEIENSLKLYENEISHSYGKKFDIIDFEYQLEFIKKIRDRFFEIDKECLIVGVNNYNKYLYKYSKNLPLEKESALEMLKIQTDYRVVYDYLTKLNDIINKLREKYDFSVFDNIVIRDKEDKVCRINVGALYELKHYEFREKIKINNEFKDNSNVLKYVLNNDRIKPVVNYHTFFEDLEKDYNGFLNS